MEYLIDPNVSYLLLVSGLVLMILAIFAPGTGLLEIGALFSLFLAGIGIYNLPVNLWALAIILAGLAAFFLSLRHKYRVGFFIAAAVLMAGGSILLFWVDAGSNHVHPLLASVTSICALGILWWAGSKGLDAIKSRPAHSLKQLIGMSGRANSDIHNEGTVYVNGEEWTAWSDELIPEGSMVEVLSREGLVLKVKNISPPHSSSPTSISSSDRK